jgi:hypothetical protein
MSAVPPLCFIDFMKSCLPFFKAKFAIILCNQCALYFQCIDHLPTSKKRSDNDVDGTGRKRPKGGCGRNEE